MEDKFGKNTENDFEMEDVSEDYDAEMSDEEIEELSQEKVKKLREQLRQCDKDKMAALEELQRNKADFLNARKRLEEERLRDRERSSMDHIDRLLPLADSFDMALADQSLANLPENLQKGIRGIHSQLASLLKTYNVESIGEPGTDFDPRVHEALAEVEVADKAQDHKVISVIQKGYKMGEMIIRPARVTVGILK